MYEVETSDSIRSIPTIPVIVLASHHFIPSIEKKSETLEPEHLKPLQIVSITLTT